MTTSFTFPTGSHPNGPVIDLHGMTGSVFLVSAFVSTPAAELASFRTRGQWKKRSECLLNILFQKSGRPEVEEPYIYIFFLDYPIGTPGLRVLFTVTGYLCWLKTCHFHMFPES